LEKQAERELKVILNKKAAITNEEFKVYYELLEKFNVLSEKIPERVKFTLFDVRCSDVKQQIRRNIHDLQ